MYTGIKFTNNASTQLFKSIASDSTELEVDDNYAAVFPKLENAGDYCMLTLQDIYGNREIVKCTSRTDSVLTVERAQEGTTAKSFPVGALLELRLTADSITKVSEDASIVKYHASTTAADVGKADATKYGHIKLSDSFEYCDQAIDGIACSPYGFQQAVARLLHVAIPVLLTESTNWTVPETGTYRIKCVGAGGAGGNGGSGTYGLWTYYDGEWTNYVQGAYSGGSGGGGGAGQVITTDVSLTKGQQIAVTIGGISGGTTTFGSYVSALGGGNGGSGTNAATPSAYAGGAPGIGGAAGTSYGSASTSGVSGTASVWDTYAEGWGAPVSVSGTTGGTAGVSVDGTYGNGGKGGNGGGASYPPGSSSAGTLGVCGTQGCVLITMTLR